MWDEQRQRDLCRRILDHCREHGIDLIYPPATDEQLQLTEDTLGFPLPSFLRMFYTEVANGGPKLGTYYGLFGCVGGYAADGYAFDDSGYAEVPRTIGRLVSRSGWRPHPCVLEALTRHPGHMVQCEEVPDGFMTISDVGCGITVELDTKTEHLYHAGCGEEMPAEDPTQPSSFLITLEYVAASLEEWLEHWLDDTLYAASVGYLTPEMVSAICESDSQLVWRGVHLPQPHYEDLPEFDGY
jgi:hypothetical protein